MFTCRVSEAISPDCLVAPLKARLDLPVGGGRLPQLRYRRVNVSNELKLPWVPHAAVNSPLTLHVVRRLWGGVMGGECAMTMDTLTCAKPNGKVSLTRQTADALRYENLSRVLVDLESRVPVPSAPKRERKTAAERKVRADEAELAELRACVATLKVENERLVDRIAEDLDAQVRQPLWRRLFGHAVPEPELAERTRRKLVGKLRSAFLDQAEPERRSA